jgi:hypothetical protein
VVKTPAGERPITSVKVPPRSIQNVQRADARSEGSMAWAACVHSRLERCEKTVATVDDGRLTANYP